MSRKTMLTIAGRLILGFLMYRYFNRSSHVEAAPSAPLVQELVKEADGRVNQTTVCTPSGMEQFLEQAKDLSDDDVELVYETCRDDFLQHNQISPEVKQSVDHWVGTDLSKAALNELFIIYQLALLGPKPEEASEQFATDCMQMVSQFDEYRSTIEPLTSYIDVDMDVMLADSAEEIDDQERDMLNYAQYTQFCKSILSQTEGSQEESKEIDLNLTNSE